MHTLKKLVKCGSSTFNVIITYCHWGGILLRLWRQLVTLICNTFESFSVKLKRFCTPALLHKCSRLRRSSRSPKLISILLPSRLFKAYSKLFLIHLLHIYIFLAFTQMLYFPSNYKLKSAIFLYQLYTNVNFLSMRMGCFIHITQNITHY